MCFFINGVAYPERIANLSVEKVEAKYRGVLEWKNYVTKPEFLGKFIVYRVEDYNEQEGSELMKGTGLYSQLVEDGKKIVLFRSK